MQIKIGRRVLYCLGLILISGIFQTLYGCHRLFERGTPQLLNYATVIVEPSRIQFLDASGKKLESFIGASKVILDNKLIDVRDDHESAYHALTPIRDPEDKYGGFPFLPSLPVDGKQYPIAWSSCTYLLDGRVFIAGGADWNHEKSHVIADRTWTFDPSSKTAVEGPKLTCPRGFHTTTLLRNGKVLITGGGWPDLSVPNALEIEVYDPGSNKIHTIGRMKKPRKDHSVVELTDGTILLIGGRTTESLSDAGMRLTSTIELLDPSTKVSKIVGQLRHAREQPVGLSLGESKALIFGGHTDVYSDAKSTIEIAELFDPIPDNQATSKVEQ